MAVPVQTCLLLILLIAGLAFEFLSCLLPFVIFEMRSETFKGLKVLLMLFAIPFFTLCGNLIKARFLMLH